MAIKANFPDIKPSLNLDFANTKRLDPRITFTRASTATYYDGKTVAKAEENLFTQSNTFQLPAANYGVLTTDVAGAPDGTSTVTQLDAQSGNNQASTIKGSNHSLTANTVFTLSCFFKANTHDYVFISLGRLSPSAFAYAIIVIDLTTGSVTQTFGTNAGTSVVDVGNGWYRCAISYELPSNTTASRAYLGIAQGATGNTFNGGFGFVDNLAAAGTESIYLWGVQLEQRSTVTAYTPTTTQRITNYIPVLQSAASGEARFDHDPITGESLGLLIEEQRTNLLTYSEEFDDSDWTKNNSTITANTVVAPDGTLTGDFDVPDGVTPFVSQSFASVSGQTYTLSFYAKKENYDFIRVNFSSTGFTTFTFAWFDLTNGTVGTTGNSPTTSITDVGNGWYRCSISKAATTTTTSSGGFSVGSADNVQTEGDGTSGIYIWGAQLEE